MHKDELPARFYRNWATRNRTTKNGLSFGTGRFQHEIGKLKRHFLKCSNKDMIRRNVGYSINSDDDLDDKTGFKKKERRSVNQLEGQLKVSHNPGHRMRHIVGNVKKWTENYLIGCDKKQSIVDRWERFETRWNIKLKGDSIFKKEFEEEERYLRNYDGPGRPCGRIYREFGLHGEYMELRDASFDDTNGYDDLRRTVFGNDQLMSMVPFEGKTKYQFKGTPISSVWFSGLWFLG